MSILTQQGGPANQTAVGLGGHGPWGIGATLTGLVLALLVGLRGRSAPLRYRQLWMALALLLASTGAIACGNGVATLQGTPAGTYNNIAITVTGSAGTSSSFTLPQLTVK